MIFNYDIASFLGKTTILYRMKRTEDFHTVPTIGRFDERFSS